MSEQEDDDTGLEDRPGENNTWLMAMAVVTVLVVVTVVGFLLYVLFRNWVP